VTCHQAPQGRSQRQAQLQALGRTAGDSRRQPNKVKGSDHVLYRHSQVQKRKWQRQLFIAVLLGPSKILALREGWISQPPSPTLWYHGPGLRATSLTTPKYSVLEGFQQSASSVIHKHPSNELDAIMSGLQRWDAKRLPPVVGLVRPRYSLPVRGQSYSELPNLNPAHFPRPAFGAIAQPRDLSLNETVKIVSPVC
jgi:hypothetical protein